jgi:hypothetical protein
MISINGHTLFPHDADWSTQPDLENDWQSGIGTGVLGNEQRSSLRALPLITCGFNITPASLQESCRLDARVDQATRSGLAAVPFFGMGSPLTAPAAAGGAALAIADAVNPWPWAAGDYAILIGLDDTQYDVLPVAGVAGNTLNLTGVLTLAWNSVWVRPLLFGRFNAQKRQPLSPWYMPLKLSVKQLVNARSAQLGATPPHVPGVGEQVIGRTNQVQ